MADAPWAGSQPERRPELSSCPPGYQNLPARSVAEDPEMLQLQDKIAVITGSSSGIGLATAKTFLRAGAVVLGVDLTPPPADFAEAKAFDALQLDLTSPGASERVIAEAMARHGRVDVLVNNAGIGNSRPVLDTSDEDLARYLSVNIAAPFALCRSAIS
ncbi:MAG: SDR family NAD(P)-dependent oxidoreductase, partial [Phreatobacter sp.]